MPERREQQGKCKTVAANLVCGGNPRNYAHKVRRCGAGKIPAYALKQRCHICEKQLARSFCFVFPIKNIRLKRISRFCLLPCYYCSLTFLKKHPLHKRGRDDGGKRKADNGRAEKTDVFCTGRFHKIGNIMTCGKLADKGTEHRADR